MPLERLAQGNTVSLWDRKQQLGFHPNAAKKLTEFQDNRQKNFQKVSIHYGYANIIMDSLWWIGPT